MTEAFPLTWPNGWARTGVRQRSNFKNTTVFKGFNEVTRELKLLGARNIVISTNVELRRDGLPVSGRRAPDDTGVAVYFILSGQEKCIPIDRWRSVEDNLHAIGMTVNAMRGIERWGAKNLVDAAFRGFTALPPPDGAYAETVSVKVKRNAWEILDIAPGTKDLDYLEFKYKTAAKKAHPDHGGSEEEFIEVRNAYEELKREVGG